MEISGYNSLWKAIIRPPRASYKYKDLGPTEFKSAGMSCIRTDLELKGARGHIMQCSHSEPLEIIRKWHDMPCVIYMHGNSSCRLEAQDLISFLLPANITLFAFDFPGCGRSEGEYISLGWHERNDVAVIINYLR